MQSNIMARIIQYDNGEMPEEEVVDFFQELVDSGIAWQLQGHYGRTASWLIREGLVRPEREEAMIYDTIPAKRDVLMDDLLVEHYNPRFVELVKAWPKLTLRDVVLALVKQDLSDLVSLDFSKHCGCGSCGLACKVCALK